MVRQLSQPPGSHLQPGLPCEASAAVLRHFTGPAVVMPDTTAWLQCVEGVMWKSSGAVGWCRPQLPAQAFFFARCHGASSRPRLHCVEHLMWESSAHMQLAGADLPQHRAALRLRGSLPE